ncbi:ubiquitin family protein [Ceratobasidium sp. AG-Ba]|nr:ubiquitin family protein [Ceratobasidium sp. AG-Ba]
MIADQYKTPALLQRLYYNGKLLEDVDSVESSGITSGTTIDLELDTRRIAIFLVTSDSGRDTYRSADIKYSVNHAWELTALSPSTGLDYMGFTQEIRWDIKIEDDGSLRDVTKSNQCFETTKFRRDPKKKLDCLLWDGLDESYTLLDRDTPPGEPTHSKDWLRSVTLVESQNSVVVRVEQLKTYLVNLLAQANWEVAQRFANCVMPDLKPKPSESWNHIAVRCLSCADSKALATLSISPQPDQVFHLALLFKPLEDSEALVWSAASMTLDNSPLLPSVQISGGFRAYELIWLKVL